MAIALIKIPRITITSTTHSCKKNACSISVHPTKLCLKYDINMIFVCKNHMTINNMYPCRRVVSVLDSGAERPGFKSQS